MTLTNISLRSSYGRCICLYPAVAITALTAYGLYSFSMVIKEKFKTRTDKSSPFRVGNHGSFKLLWTASKLLHLFNATKYYIFTFVYNSTLGLAYLTYCLQRSAFAVSPTLTRGRLMFARFDPNFGLFIGKFPANACATDEFLNARQSQLSYRRLLYKSRSRDNAISPLMKPRFRLHTAGRHCCNIGICLLPGLLRYWGKQIRYIAL